MRSNLGILAAAILAMMIGGSTLAFAKGKNARKPLPGAAPQLAAMGFQPPQMLMKAGGCKTLFQVCLRECDGNGASCLMGCEVDCGACSVENGGAPDTKDCEK